MRVTYHIGLHCTDEDRALSCLLANAALLAREGCAIPRPARFRPALREAMLSLKGAAAPAELQERLLDAVLETDRPGHILFSSDSFLCVPQKALASGQLYPLARERAAWIRNLFAGHETTICLALRNPATLLPALQERLGADAELAALLGSVDPGALSWLDMVERLAAGLADTRIVVWCNEDAAILWPEILALLAGRADGRAEDLEGWDAFLGDLLPAQALDRMRSYLAAHPPRDPVHRRRVIAAFLDRFADPAAIEQSVDLPGWDEDTVAQVTARYEADIARIGRLPGIELLLP
jgi:hypothetical protein